MIAIAPFPRRLARWLARLLGLVLVVACGSEFSGSSPPSDPGAAGAAGAAGEPPAGTTNAGGPASEPGAAGAAGEPPASAGGQGNGGEPAQSGGAAGAGAEPTCTPLQPDQPSLPARCQDFQNKGCNPGSTCITLEQRGQFERDLCMPTGITTSCADSGCLADYTCACLQADFRFDKTGLESWKCCDTAAGPLYVLPPITCP